VAGSAITVNHRRGVRLQIAPDGFLRLFQQTARAVLRSPLKCEAAVFMEAAGVAVEYLENRQSSHSAAGPSEVTSRAADRSWMNCFVSWEETSVSSIFRMC
jgi:hypothetical protein